MPLRDPNAPVRGTDNDAATSRLSAVQLGYFRDDFARHMVSRPQQRPPLINIGTHARTWAIDALVESFLAAQPETGASKQIISLGAGSDTRFFRLQKNCPSLWHRIRRYIELDFEESTARKIQVIKRHPEFHQALPDGFELEQGGTALKSKAYHVLPVDLRSFLDDLAQKLLEGQDAILDPSIVTLLLLECVCIYISPQVTQPLLDWTARTFTSAAVVWYDPINLTDAFGRMMVNNLRSRHIELHGIEGTDQKKRLHEAGFKECVAETVLDIRHKYIPRSESERISQLEFLDEIEELELVLSHYAISWASNNPTLAFGLSAT